MDEGSHDEFKRLIASLHSEREAHIHAVIKKYMDLAAQDQPVLPYLTDERALRLVRNVSAKEWDRYTTHTTQADNTAVRLHTILTQLGSPYGSP